MKDLNPPAIVAPAPVFADELTALGFKILTLGRRTIAQKVELGNLLIEAMEEIDRRNETIKARKDQISKEKWYARHGLSKFTACRLMTQARSHNSGSKLLRELDGIYDDGIDPTLDADKKPCRDCRVYGKPFSKKCKTCATLNAPVPEPKPEAGPPKDEDGNLIPEHLVPVFAEGKLLRTEFVEHLHTAVKVLKGLAQRPGFAAANIDGLIRDLRTTSKRALKYRAGYVHLECEGKGCEKCHDGWRTVMEVMDERAAVANAEKRKKAKEWHERQAKNSQPIPE